MAQALPFYLVDAFAEEAFRGNPAGVVFEADGLSDDQLQRMAAEIGASETAFISGLNNLHRPPRLRWFTPTTEVEFCGHATLAAAHAVHAWGCAGDLRARAEAVLRFDTAAGELCVSPEWLPDPDDQPLWWLNMPAPDVAPADVNPVRLCELLGGSDAQLDDRFPPARTRDRDVIVFVESWQGLMDLRPRFDDLAAWCERQHVRGVCVATTETLSNAVAVHSRFFAPACGVNEDPVTGSVHGPLAAYLAAHGVGVGPGDRAALVCAQGVPGGRTGLVRAIVEPGSKGRTVRIAGACHVTIQGTIRVPPAPG